MRSKWLSRIAVAAALLAALPLLAPQLLAFPYSTRINRHRVYSEAPIDPALTKIVANADAMVRNSALGSARPLNQSIFLTSGGWRWTWLALRSRMAFAISKPLLETIVVNRSNAAHDLVETGASIAGRRNLHGTLAHEMTHGTIRAHFGLSADWRYPAELTEGYCDYVAGGGSLTDAEAQALEASGKSVPALLYWRGRKKVEAQLAQNRGNVDALFAEWRN